MTAQGLNVIDHTVQLTHEWINELAARLNWSSSRDVLRLMRVTLQAVRDHTQINESAQFSAQLPLLIRGMYFEGWVPSATPVKDRHAHTFIRRIEAKVEDVADYRGLADIQAVFKLLNSRISRGEVEDMRANLPEEIRELWPSP